VFLGRLLERVEVADNHVDQGKIVFLNILQIAVVLSPGKNASENFGVEGFYPTSQDVGIPRHISNFRYQKPCFPQVFRSPRTGEQFPAQVGQRLRQFCYPRLVIDGEKRAPHFHRRHLLSAGTPVWKSSESVFQYKACSVV